MLSMTEQLARFISGFKGDEIGGEGIRNSKAAVLDTIGVALAGFQEPVSKILREYVQMIPCREEATIWGTTDKISALDAALVNGTTAHALDYDDCNRMMLGHPSAVLVPTVFAVAEMTQCSGRKLLEGYIVGFEVVARLGRVLNTGLSEKGWHPTSVLGVMGTCASASYLLNLSDDQTRNALGVTASEASGIKKNFGSMTKPFHAGSAARKGIWCATLAQRGLAADPEGLDGTFGFLEMFQGDSRYDLQRLGALGEPLEIIGSGLVFKQYPCCGSMHSAVDGCIDLRQQGPVSPEQIAEIECKVNPRRIPYTNRPQVRNVLEAKFSFQYCVAAALLDGFLGLGHFTEESVARPEVRNLMEKVRMVPDEHLAEFAAEVSVTTKDGRSFSKMMAEAKGSPALPLSDAEVMRKFIDCAQTTMSYSRAEEAAERIMGIDDEPQIGDFLKILCEK